MNEPWRWAFLCIWYENSWFWVHEVKRLRISFYMALCIPFHLWQRTSRVYQDLLRLRRVLTSFVPPAHNQGVSFAPVQGLALWKIYLPTTGSFFSYIYWLPARFLIPAPCGGRFPVNDSTCLQLSCHSWIQSTSSSSWAQFNCDKHGSTIPVLLYYAACIWGLRISPIIFSGL